MRALEAELFSSDSTHEEITKEAHHWAEQASINAGWVPGERKWGFVNLNWPIWGRINFVSVNLMLGTYHGVYRRGHDSFEWVSDNEHMTKILREDSGSEHLDAIFLTELLRWAGSRLPNEPAYALVDFINGNPEFGYSNLSVDKRLQIICKRIQQTASISGPMTFKAQPEITPEGGFAILKTYNGRILTFDFIEGEGRVTIERNAVRKPRGRLIRTAIEFSEFPTVLDIYHKPYENQISWSDDTVVHFWENLSPEYVNFLTEYLPTFMKISSI